MSVLTKAQHFNLIDKEAQEFVDKLINKTENVIETENLKSIVKRFYKVSAEHANELSKQFKLKYNIPENETYDVWFDIFNGYLFDKINEKMNT